jgi:hypothetical protein
MQCFSNVLKGKRHAVAHLSHATQASEALCEHTRARLDEQMGLFQGHALHGCLQIPPGLDLSQVLGYYNHCDKQLLVCLLMLDLKGAVVVPRGVPMRWPCWADSRYERALVWACAGAAAAARRRGHRSRPSSGRASQGRVARAADSNPGGALCSAADAVANSSHGP